MTINTQVKWESLRSLGYTGVQEEMELQYYLSNGATISSVRDAEMQFLEAQGFSIGAVQDRWKAFLLSLGYTGSIDDMLNIWWTTIVVTTTSGLLLEIGDYLLLEDGSLMLLE